jgi:SAM-dependent methyltransferase
MANPSPSPQTDPAALEYRRARQAHWDVQARQRDSRRGWAGLYHRRLQRVYRFLVSPGQRILEIGCGDGSLLAALEPFEGVGVDFSAEMLKRAAECYPNLCFLQADAHNLAALDGEFDVILLSDLVDDLWDVQAVLEQVQRLSGPRTRLILNYYSHLWEFPLSLAQRLGLATSRLDQNWLTNEDLANLLHLAGFEVLRCWQEMLWPLPFPLLEPLCNRFLVRLWPFKDMALANFVITRPQADCREAKPSVSVIVPARNEAGNIPAIFERLPEMGGETELIFVEGHSRDDTAAVIEREIARHPERRCQFFRQTGTGKADAVRLGFAHATGDILMILDADLTVLPEDLPRFYTALVSNKGEFINGVRLVYPMERQAMRSFNLLGNKFFSLAFSWLLGQPLKDTLCGTKALWLFGAAKLNLRITDLPIRYRERTYGTTNIQRWKHGLLLLKMVLFAARRLKFI